MPDEPAVDGRRLVRPVVIEKEMHLQLGGDCMLDGIEELAELDRPVAAVALADHCASLHIQGGEQGGGPVARVVVHPPLCLAGPHRQQRLGPIQGLNLALLVRAQHQGLVQRVEVQSHNVPHLLDKQRVLRELEGVAPMRLPPERPPDTTDGRLAEAARFGHRPRAPMRRIPRGLFQCHRNHAFHLDLDDAPRGVRPRLIQEPGDALVQEAAAPPADRLPRHAPLGGHRADGGPRPAGQDDASPLGERLGGLRPARAAI